MNNRHYRAGVTTTLHPVVPSPPSSSPVRRKAILSPSQLSSSVSSRATVGSVRRVWREPSAQKWQRNQHDKTRDSLNRNIHARRFATGSPDYCCCYCCCRCLNIQKPFRHLRSTPYWASDANAFRGRIAIRNFRKTRIKT